MRLAMRCFSCGWQSCSISQRQAGGELQVITRLPVAQLTLQTLEGRHVVTCLYAKPDASVAPPNVQTQRTEAKEIGLRTDVVEVAVVVRATTATYRHVWASHQSPGRGQVRHSPLDTDVILKEIH